MADLDDRRVIACNYAQGTKVCKKGARAYVTLTNPGSGHERIELLARSRGGRWVNKWENIRYLKDFRLTTIPPEHPLFDNQRLLDDTGRTVAMLERARAHRTEGTSPNAPLRWVRAGYECVESEDVGLHRPPVVRINPVGIPQLVIYYDLGHDDIAFAVIMEHMLAIAGEGAFG